MDQFINQNLEEREETRAALTQKLEALETRLRENIGKVKETIKRTTDVPYQVKQRPWEMFGLSVVAGCALGRLMTCSGTRAGISAENNRESPAGSGIDKQSIQGARTGNGHGDPYAQQLSVIKGATIGAIATILSELARHAVPTLLAQLENFSQNQPGNAPDAKLDEAARFVRQ